MHLDGSNSLFVECNGSQMNYSRMSLPSDCKQLMCQASCMSVPQTTGKPAGMRGNCSLLTFPQPHLKTWVTTEMGSCSHFGLCNSSWCPPRDANNCDAQWTLMGGGGYMCQLMAPAKLSALGHQPKGTPVEMALPGFSGILKHV